MTGICKDNSYTFRNELTINKEYEVLELYNDPYAGYPMILIINDSGENHPYRANRFKIN
jgi:hypothetical protein